MKARRLPPERLPGWPKWLCLELAAAFVGVAPGAFLKEVAAGIWPAPWRRGGHGVPTWDRDLIQVSKVDRQQETESNRDRQRLIEKARSYGKAQREGALPHQEEGQVLLLVSDEEH